MEPEIDSDFVSVETTGAGLLLGRSGITAGYTSKTQVFLNDASRCRIVVFDFPDDANARAGVIHAIRQSDDVCVIDQGGNDDEDDYEDD